MITQYASRNICLLLTIALTMVCGSLAAQNATAAPPLAAAGNVTSSPTVFEDWTTPSLDTSHLKMAEPLVGEVDDVDGVYTAELTRVIWRPGDPIDLYIMKPDGVKNPPVILYLYSYPFETDKFLNHAFCKFLVKNGYAAVGFASALTGQRYHDRPMKEWFVSEMPEALADSAHDVQMILNYLAQRGDFDMNRVGMFGDGSGATIAILAAAADPRIKTLDLLNPWGDWPDWVPRSTRIPEDERPNYLKPEWLAKVAPLDPMKWLPQLTTQKIRLQFVKTVPITPYEAQQKMEAAAPKNVQIVRYDNLTAFRNSVADGSGFDWIKQQVGGGAPIQNAAVKPQSNGSSTSAQK